MNVTLIKQNTVPIPSKPHFERHRLRNDAEFVHTFAGIVKLETDGLCFMNTYHELMLYFEACLHCEFASF